MSGRKINDHKSWMGGASKGSVFPEGVKHKMESSAEGSGHEADYPDTTEHVKRDQEHAKSKIGSKPMKPGFRY